MRVSRLVRTATLAVLVSLAAACMGGGSFPTEIPPTPGGTHANRVLPLGTVATPTARIPGAPRQGPR
jgi:hypothetical protein